MHHAATYRWQVLLKTAQTYMLHHRVKKFVAFMVHGLASYELLKDSQEPWQLIASHNLGCSFGQVCLQSHCTVQGHMYTMVTDA